MPKPLVSSAALWLLLAWTLFAAPPGEVFFSPHGGATAAVVHEIEAARTTILVQAYSFTSRPIAGALCAAHRRGVVVRVLLDRSNESQRRSVLLILESGLISVSIDDHPAIAHSKVMVIDGQVVLTGSFNFTQAAENRNVENLLILHDAGLAARYRLHFEERWALSRPLRRNSEGKALSGP